MNRPPEGLPEQWRTTDATELERRVLEAASRELPSRELCERMSQALGITAVGIGSTPDVASTAHTGNSTGSTAGTAPAVAGPIGVLLPWVSAGLVVLAIAAGVTVAQLRSGTRKETSSGSSSAEPVRPLPSTSHRVAEVVTLPASQSTALTEAAPASAHRVRTNAANIDLRDQITLVDNTRASLSEGAADRTLALIQQYQAKYPNGLFRPEVMALKIEALVKLGRATEARSLAERFVAAHRGTPIADRVARIAGLEKSL